MRNYPGLVQRGNVMKATAATVKPSAENKNSMASQRVATLECRQFASIVTPRAAENAGSIIPIQT